jgi:hypothetical protein
MILIPARSLRRAVHSCDSRIKSPAQAKRGLERATFEIERATFEIERATFDLTFFALCSSREFAGFG